MIKLGNCWVDPACIEAVTPAKDEPGYCLFLAGGRILTVTGVTAAAMDTFLHRAGLTNAAAAEGGK